MSHYTKQLAGVLFAVALISPLAASAQTTTTDVSSQIQSLLSQIQALQSQLKTLLAIQTGSHEQVSVVMPGTGMMGSTTVPQLPQQASPCATFARDLHEGSRGQDVSDLQEQLQQQGFLHASSTGFFGPMTAHALAMFQEHEGIASSSTGFFGPRSRAFFGRQCGKSGDQQENQNQGEGERQRPMMPWNGSTTLPMGSTTLPVGEGMGPEHMQQGGEQQGGPAVQNQPMIPAPMMQEGGGGGAGN